MFKPSVYGNTFVYTIRKKARRMKNKALNIVQESLAALFDDPTFLPELQNEKRIKAFSSLTSLLSTPNHVHKSFLRVALENGNVVRIPAYRVQHNNILGPYKGGIRFHETVGEEEVILLSSLMTLKNALHNVPFGGGKGGVVINPRDFDVKDLHTICVKYVQYFSKVIGPNEDIPAPDVGTSEREMDWMMGEFKSIHPGRDYLGSFTGKSVENGGSLGRSTSTGKGVYLTFRYFIHDFVKEQKSWLEDRDTIEAKKVLQLYDQSLTIAFQGFGNVGSVAALEAYQCSYIRNKVVAVSDRNVTLFQPDGLDIPALVKFAEKHSGDLPQTKEELKDANVQAEILDREDILYLEVDVLFLVALENQLHEQNKEKVKANVIVEGANGPITNEADEYLRHQNVLILPDILSNAGGVIVSYFEWIQGKETQFLSEEEVFQKLYDKMKETFNKVFPSFFSNSYSLRKTCYIHAVMKLSTIMYRQGKLY